MSSALAPSLVVAFDVGPGGQQHADDLGRVAARVRRRRPRAAGCGRWPGRAGRRRRPRRSSRTHQLQPRRRRRRRAARRCRRRRRAPSSSSAAAAAPPKAAQDSRSTPLARSSGRRAVVEVRGSAGRRRPGRPRSARRPAAPSSRSSGTSSGRSSQRDVQRRAVELGARGQVGPGLHQHADDRPACPSATARCSGVQPPCPSRSTVRPSRPGRRSRRRVRTRVDVAGGDQPAQALDGHASGHCGTSCRWVGAGSGLARSDDVAPDRQQGAQDGGQQTVAEQQQPALPRARAGRAAWKSPSSPAARRRAATCRRPASPGCWR